MDDPTLDKYVKLLVSSVGIAKGSRLRIATEPCHWELCGRIAAEAYRAGAAYVHVDAVDPAFVRARVENAPEDTLGFVPPFEREKVRLLVEERWSYLALIGSQDPWALDDVDTRRFGLVRRAISESRTQLLQAQQRDRFPWLVAVAPTAAWARQVLSGDRTRAALAAPGSDSQFTERLWDLLVPILRLDRKDPAAAWREQSALLANRAAALTGAAFDRLHFTGPGTDLTVGLPRGHVWIGGGSETSDGTWFLANLPTEEVFTTPDYRRTSGEVTVTRPVVVMDRLVDGIQLTFEEGRLVDLHAESGEDSLREYIDTDENAGMLGEIALVDRSSPLAANGLLFYEGLLDENASCHLALGSAYPTALSGGASMSREELLAAGANVSRVHLDMMIGSESVNVEAYDAENRSYQVMEAGRFVAPEPTKAEKGRKPGVRGEL